MERKVLIVTDDFNALYVDYDYIDDFLKKVFFDGAVDFFVLTNNAYSLLIYNGLKNLQKEFKCISVTKVTAPHFFLKSSTQKKFVPDDENKTFICPVDEKDFEDASMDCAIYLLEYVDKVYTVTTDKKKYEKLKDKTEKLNKKIFFTNALS